VCLLQQSFKKSVKNNEQFWSTIFSISQVINWNLTGERQLAEVNWGFTQGLYVPGERQLAEVNWGFTQGLYVPGERQLAEVNWGFTQGLYVPGESPT